jgi:thiazole synthase ThiGH ThiG subunit
MSAATSDHAALRSVLAWPANVGAVLDCHDRNAVQVIVDAVDHPVVASPGAAQSGEAALEWLADPAGILGQ